MGEGSRGFKRKEERGGYGRYDQVPASLGLRSISPDFKFLRETSLSLRPPLLFSGSSYSPVLDYRFSTPPFPLLAPLDVLPFTTTSFPPLCSSPRCCLSCISTYRSQRLFFQGFSSRTALHIYLPSQTFPLLGQHTQRNYHCVSTR